MILRKEGKIEVKPYVFWSLLMTGINLLIIISVYAFYADDIGKGWKTVFSVSALIQAYWIFQISSKAYRSRFLIANEGANSSIKSILEEKSSYYSSLEKAKQDDFAKACTIRFQEFKFKDEGECLSEEDRVLFIAAGLICFDRLNWEVLNPLNKVHIGLDKETVGGKKWYIPQYSLKSDPEEDAILKELSTKDKLQNKARLVISRNPFMMLWLDKLYGLLSDSGKSKIDFITYILSGETKDNELEHVVQERFALSNKSLLLYNLGLKK